MSAKSPFMIKDNASGLCWTASTPINVKSNFTLQTCIKAFPPTDSQRFVTVTKYSSGSSLYNSPDNKAMTILDSTSVGATWGPDSLCLSFNKNSIVTMKCGANGTFALDSSLGPTCHGSDIVDKKTIVAYPCPSPPKTFVYKPWNV